MGFLGLVRGKGLFGVSWGVPGANTWKYAQAWSRGLDLPGTAAALERPYAQHAVISTALSIFVADAASVGWEMYQDGNDEDPLDSHPFLDLLAKPSTFMTGYQLAIGTFLSIKLTGEAWWYYPDVVLGRPEGLRATSGPRGDIILLNPKAMFRNNAGNWAYLRNGIEVTLDQKRLTQFKNWNPYNPDRGLSEIESVILEAEGDQAAANYNRAFFHDQHGVPPAVLIPSVEAPSVVTERDAFLERFRAEAESKRRRIGMVPPGWAWQDVGLSAKDMEFRSLREYSRELILGRIGVPPFMAGVLDKANYANAREQREAYWMGPQTRFLTAVQDTINNDVLPKLGITGVSIFPCWESVLSLIENLAEKVDLGVKLWQIGVPLVAINKRLKLGLDLDKLPHAKIGFLPFSVAPADTIMEPPEPPPVDDEDDPEDPPPPKGYEFKRLTAKDAEARERKRSSRWRSLATQTRDLEANFNAILRRHMHEIETEVLANVNGVKGWLVSQRKGVEDDLLFDKDAAKKRLQAQTKTIQKITVKRGGDTVIAEIDASIDFDLMDLRVNAKLLELQHKIKRIDDTIEKLLRESLNEGLLAGESPQELAKRVSSVMDATKARSMTIARTETGAAFNAGRHEGMRQAGVELQEWLTARDTKVRDAHVELDGEVVAVGDTFSNGLRYPLDQSGPPGEVINCFVPGTRVSGSFVGGLKARYSGPVREIETRGGRRLTVTPNHPVLTAHGLVPAGSIAEGDDLICCGPDFQGGVERDVHDENVPTTIQDVFDAFASDGTVRLAMVGRHDLHGDAERGDGKVHVVGADRELRFGLDPSAVQYGDHLPLEFPHAVHPEVVGFRPRDLSLDGVHRTAPGVPRLGQLDRSPAAVLDRLPLLKFGCGPAAHIHAVLSEETKQQGAGYAEFSSELLLAGAGSVALDRVVRVRELNFDGHVYDLQSEVGWIVAEGIFCSNCRCTPVPVIGGRDE